MVLCCIVAVLGAGMGTIRAFASYQGNSTGLTEQELYNQTNTYNISGDCFNENGTFKSVSDSNYEHPQYRLSYVMTVTYFYGHCFYFKSLAAFDV